MSVTLRQLEAFRIVWAKGSLREAAIAMSITHSAVHRLISQLEANMNERLFDRDHGEARPTETAVTLAANVDRVMTSLDRVVALAHEETRINRASLRIGAITSISPAIIPSALRVLRQQFQELRVSIDIQKQTDIEIGFKRGDYDLCLVW